MVDDDAPTRAPASAPDAPLGAQADPGSAAATAPRTTGTDPTGSQSTDATPPGRRRLRAEVLIVLGLSLGQSAVYAAVNLYSRFTAEVPLAAQSTTLHPTRSPRPYLDLTYQLLAIGFALVPVALALYLLSGHGRSALRRIGLDATRPLRDLGIGLGLTAVVGIPGIGVYVAGRALGVTVEVQASGLAPYWWTIPVLVLSAVQNALLEEVVAVGYLVTRLEQLRWSAPLVIAGSALLRGAYHLYQGPGMAVGNVAMGVLFTWYYLRTRRVMPLVVAHTALDVFAFVGTTVLPADLLTWIGVT